MDWIKSIDWKFVIGDIIVPVGLFVIGFFVGEGVERRKNKAKAKVKGDQNIIIQNSDIHK